MLRVVQKMIIFGANLTLYKAVISPLSCRLMGLSCTWRKSERKWIFSLDIKTELYVFKREGEDPKFRGMGAQTHNAIMRAIQEEEI